MTIFLVTMYRHFFRLLLISFLFVGCVVTSPVVSKTRITQLSLLLHSLDQTVPYQEATRLSKDIFHETAMLTKEFELTSPPWFHNVLVNVGLREKGLCYHWSDVLYVHLLQKRYPHFEFHLVGANIGEYFWEHNALVIVAKNGSIKNGILIDPWRNSGKLYFTKIDEDKKYEWRHREKRGCNTI